MKSLNELMKIKDYCEKKQASFQKGSVEYTKQAEHIISLKEQIEEQRGGWSNWDEVSDGDGYLGDGVYASGHEPN